MKRLLLTLCLLISPVAFANNTQQLLQLLDYVGVDYAEAIEDGKVINAGEYDEMLEFSEAIASSVAGLPWSEAKAPLQQASAALKVAIETKRPPADIAAMTSDMRGQIMGSYNIVAVPSQKPDLQLAKQLYSTSCMACHGATGMGDGPAAKGLDPAPTDFLDYERHAQRSLFGLYNTITLGVSETAMSAFSQMSDHERWSLAFYVGSLANTTTQAAGGKANHPALNDLNTVSTITPAEAYERYGDAGVAQLSMLRHDPSSLFEKGQDPLQMSRDLMAQTLEKYTQGATKEAQQLAVQAYLDGFEVVESGLSIKNSELAGQIESEMTAFRNLLRNEIPVESLKAKQQHIDGLLIEAQTTMASQGLSSSGAFASSFIILLREGLEAILVLAALFAFLLKTNRRDALPYLHAGWIGAIFAGGLTWWASVSLFTISGAMREITEGLAALVAAGILFYVGFWMHSKTSAQQWQKFIEGSVSKALSSTTLWSITGLAFISVYREMFETILFYQAIWVQTDTSGHSMIFAGMLVASAALLVLGGVILKYSTKLPLRQFFAVTGAFLFILAVVFAGKGIAALQEAGNLPHDPMHIPLISSIGFSDSLQGLMVQGVMVALTAWLIWGRKGKGADATA